MKKDNLGCVVEASVKFTTRNYGYSMTKYIPGKLLTADEAKEYFGNDDTDVVDIRNIYPVIYASNRFKHIKAQISARLGDATNKSYRHATFNIPKSYFSGIIIGSYNSLKLYRVTLSKVCSLEGCSAWIDKLDGRLKDIKIGYHNQYFDAHYLSLDGYIDFKDINETEDEYVKRLLNDYTREYYDNISQQIALVRSSEDWNG